jgi:hypothetical protein
MRPTDADPGTGGPGCDLGGRSTLIRASRFHRYEPDSETQTTCPSILFGLGRPICSAVLRVGNAAAGHEAEAKKRANEP